MQKISTPPRSWAEVMAAAKVALACRQERCKQLKTIIAYSLRRATYATVHRRPWTD